MSADFQFEGGYTAESWDYARAFAGTMGQLPSTFTSVIRLLINDFDKNPGKLTEYGRFFAGRLLKSPTVQAPYFHAIRYMKPRLVNPGEPFALKDFINAFNGYEHACMLASIFLYRHSRRVCDRPLLDKIVPRIQRGLNFGWFIGNALPSIGGGAGLLAGGFRAFGFLPFIKHDLDGFKKYHAHLSSHRLASDVDYEFQRWQCNSLQVALMMFQQLGFGTARLVPLMRAVTTTSPLLNRDEAEQRFRVIDVWMESLSVHKSAPSIPLPPKYYPGPRKLNELIQIADSSLHTDEAAWLTRSKEDVTEESTPELFLGQQRVQEQTPSEMHEALPEETINELSSKLLKDFLNEEESEN
jgi:hypothetical protein